MGPSDTLQFVFNASPLMVCEPPSSNGIGVTTAGLVPREHDTLMGNTMPAVETRGWVRFSTTLFTVREPFPLSAGLQSIVFSTVSVGPAPLFGVSTLAGM